MKQKISGYPRALVRLTQGEAMCLLSACKLRRQSLQENDAEPDRIRVWKMLEKMMDDARWRAQRNAARAKRK